MENTITVEELVMLIGEQQIQIKLLQRQLAELQQDGEHKDDSK